MTKREHEKMAASKALLCAASHIAIHPEEFSFNVTDVPHYPGCGAPGCALGWAAAFFGAADYDDLLAAMGTYELEFYKRMNNAFGSDAWSLNATDCAKTMRLYVAKYFPEIEVCDNCLQACCWQGYFMCDESRGAGTIMMRRDELEPLGLEHPSYWETE